MLTAVTQRWRAGRASYRPAGEPIVTRHYEIVAIAQDRIARDYCERWHYSGSYPAARHRFGLYHHSQLQGVAVFSVPCNDQALSMLPGERLERIELGRFVLDDAVPSNGESWFLARAFELLRREGLLSVLAFSDPEPRCRADGAVLFGGHIGTIYQATNAAFLGRGTARTLRLLPDGRTMSARAIQTIRARERGWRYAVAQLVAAGAPPPADGEDLRAWLTAALAVATRPLRHAGNLRYAWTLDRRLRAHLPASQPYPKVAVPQLALPLERAA